jgi:hypothetical protein
VTAAVPVPVPVPYPQPVVDAVVAAVAGSSVTAILAAAVGRRSGFCCGRGRQAPAGTAPAVERLVDCWTGHKGPTDQSSVLREEKTPAFGQVHSKTSPVVKRATPTGWWLVVHPSLQQHQQGSPSYGGNTGRGLTICDRFLAEAGRDDRQENGRPGLYEMRRGERAVSFGKDKRGRTLVRRPGAATDRPSESSSRGSRWNGRGRGAGWNWRGTARCSAARESPPPPPSSSMAEKSAVSRGLARSSFQKPNSAAIGSTGGTGCLPPRGAREEADGVEDGVED